MPTITVKQIAGVHHAVACTPQHSRNDFRTAIACHTATGTVTLFSGSGAKHVSAKDVKLVRKGHLVFGHGRGDLLLGSRTKDDLTVWSTLTGDVVAIHPLPPHTRDVQFDLQGVVATTDEMVLYTDMHDPHPTWHVICTSTNVKNVVPAWPFVVALMRDGGCMVVANVECGTSEATALGTEVFLSADHATVAKGTFRHAQSRGTSARAAPAAKRRAHTKHKRTAAAAGALKIVDGVAEWLSLANGSRHLCLNRLDLAGLTSNPSTPKSIHVQRLEWPAAHNTKYPALAMNASHVTSSEGEGNHATTHVLFHAVDAADGSTKQMLHTTHGDWHRTHVLSEDSTTRSLVATDSTHCVGMLQERGRYATITFSH